MGLGIALMHYVAMAATSFHLVADAIEHSRHVSLLLSVSVIAFLIQGGGIVTVLMDENLKAKDKIINLERQFIQAQKMEAMGTLVGGIAHDFNNMLSGISGNLYLAKKKLGDLPEVRQKIERAEELGKHASEMIKQLLVFSRSDSVKMEKFSLKESIETGFKLAKVAIPGPIKCTADLCDDPLYVNGNKTQIQQMVMNLCNNARDALLDTENPEIICSLKPFEGNDDFFQRHPGLKGQCFAHLTIQDNGSGIPQDRLDHIFDPFFTTKEVGRGTGLGLSMVYGTVQTHRGAIEVESYPGRGTSFHIYLPTV